MLSKMYEEMRKVVGPAANIMMREFGKSFAEAMAEVAKAGDGENTKEAMATFLENVGFGKVSISKNEDKYIVEIHSPPSCELNVESCNFEEGVVQGLLEVLEGGKWRAKTTEFKDSKCIIEATRY